MEEHKEKMGTKSRKEREREMEREKEEREKEEKLKKVREGGREGCKGGSRHFGLGGLHSQKSEIPLGGVWGHDPPGTFDIFML